LQNFNRSQDDFFRWQRASAFDGEFETGVILSNPNGFAGQAKLATKLGALLTERALVRVLNLDLLFKFIELKDLSRTLRNKLAFLSSSQLFVDYLLVECYNWLFSHNAG